MVLSIANGFLRSTKNRTCKIFLQVHKDQIFYRKQKFASIS